MYRPAAAAGVALAADSGRAVRQLATWKQQVRQAWGGTALRRLSAPQRELSRSGQLQMRIAAALNGLGTTDVVVEFLGRRLLPKSRYELPALASIPGGADDRWRVELRATGEIDSDGSLVYELDAVPPTSGQYEIEVRMRPAHPLLAHPLEMGLLRRLD
jgi:starch phosphorylase